MITHCNVVARADAEAGRGQTPSAGPASYGRDPLRPAQRRPLGVPAPGVGSRVGHDGVESRKRTQPGRLSTSGQQAPPHRRRQGIPLAVSLTGGNHNDVTHPDALLAHRGYDHDKYRRLPPGPRDPTGDREARQSPRHRPGHLRYFVERTIAWLHDFRRVRIRWERRDDIHEAFLGLAVCRSPIATSNGFVRNRMAGPHRHECWSAALARSGFDADRGSTGRNLDRRRLRFQQRPEDCRQGWGSVPGCPTPGCSSRSAH